MFLGVRIICARHATRWNVPPGGGQQNVGPNALVTLVLHTCAGEDASLSLGKSPTVMSGSELLSGSPEEKNAK